MEDIIIANATKPAGIHISCHSPTRQSMLIIYMNIPIAPIMFAVNSGTTCASVGSTWSALSQIMFLYSPEERACTAPSGIVLSFLSICLRALPMSPKVAP